jgi:hypothetical protein
MGSRLLQDGRQDQDSRAMTNERKNLDYPEACHLVNPDRQISSTGWMKCRSKRGRTASLTGFQPLTEGPK